MMRRLLKSRGSRKFFRNKMALAASAFILLYLAMALAIWMGTLSRDDAKERVLPNLQPGFLEAPDLEDRFNRLKWFVRDHLNKAFPPGGLASHEHPERLLQVVALAERRMANVPLESLEAMWVELEAEFSDLDRLWLEREAILGDHSDLELDADDLRLTIQDMRDEGEDPAEIADAEDELRELEAEGEAMLAEATPLEAEIRERMEAVQPIIDRIMPLPTGWSGLVYAFRTFLGSDTSGRSIAVQSFYGIKLAFQVGVVVGLMSVAIGTLLGAAGGFFGGWIDHLVMWLVSVLSSVPYLIWLAVFAYLFLGSGLFDNPAEHPELQLVKLYVAMGLTFWVGTCRVIRGEVMKIKELEYVQAATAIGFGRVYIMVKHVVPNTAHLMFINFSLIFIGAIKAEVILTFLGLGVTGQPSWGWMISLGRDDVQQFFFWTVLSPTVLMFGLVLAFNVVSDALQDAFDPRHVG